MMGMPSAYIEERLARAEHHARAQKKRVFDILCEWWRSDQKRTPPKAEKREGFQNHSYDIDDFFQAAVARAFESMEIEDG